MGRVGRKERIRKEKRIKEIERKGKRREHEKKEEKVQLINKRYLWRHSIVWIMASRQGSPDLGLRNW